MSTPYAGTPLAQAALLLRLRRLRQEQAEAALRAARDEQHQALAAVQRAQQRLDGERSARAALLDAFGSAPGLPRVAGFAEARREAVTENLERAEYALLDDEETLQAADHALLQAGHALRRARARRDAADEALQQARRDDSRAREHRAEREAPEHGAASPRPTSFPR
jgi:hypothetical protein